MKVIFFLLIYFSTISLCAENYEEKFYKNPNDIPQGFGTHMDVGYSSYFVELDSSEINSAIAYDLLESTVGFSYVYGRWMWGCYGKFLLNELKSNMYLLSTQEKLNDNAQIEKKEFAFYLNRMLIDEKDSRWNINFLYRESRLNARDSYDAFNAYDSYFIYETKGFALSLVYTNSFYEKQTWFATAGLLYTQADVKVGEIVNNLPQDASISDHSSAIGAKVALGYNYQLFKDLILNLRVDTWCLNFSKLDVDSAVGDQLPKASLQEQALSSYLGFTWLF